MSDELHNLAKKVYDNTATFRQGSYTEENHVTPISRMVLYF